MSILKLLPICDVIAHEMRYDKMLQVQEGDLAPSLAKQIDDLPERNTNIPPYSGRKIAARDAISKEKMRFHRHIFMRHGELCISNYLLQSLIGPSVNSLNPFLTAAIDPMAGIVADLKIADEGFDTYPSPSLAVLAPHQFSANEPLEQSLFPWK
ncbi:uncharacterized protein A4U43_C08F30230 [Asparagus officinalis]|nr:uncharacterized protein A4U43_C08F30230 [Asparagus officinalis]